jgi:addiction module HigA family antidote
MTRNPLIAGLRPTHPGEILREDVLPGLNISKVAFAKALGLSRQNLYGILGGRLPITTPTAMRLGKVCGNGPELWLTLQQRYDIAEAESTMADELARLPTLHAA